MDKVKDRAHEYAINVLSPQIKIIKDAYLEGYQEGISHYKHKKNEKHNSDEIINLESTFRGSKLYKTMQDEKGNDCLPKLYVRVCEDKDHVEAQKLYVKTAQFKLTQLNYIFCKNVSSIYFELFINKEESLGICSALTYYKNQDGCILLNWAIDSYFFEIGLEEFIMNYMFENIRKNIDMIWQDYYINNKIKSLINKYYGSIIMDDCSSIPNESKSFIPYLPYNDSTKKMLQNINDYIGCYSLFFLTGDNANILKDKTNLRVYNIQSNEECDKNFFEELPF